MININISQSLKEMYSVNFNQRMNSQFGYLNMNPKNLTHLGAITFMVNQDLPVLKVRLS